jgi:branched-chain amino acid transport system ATP-binding protein
MAPLLKISNLVKSFGGLRALDGVNLAIEKHEIVGVIGPNGSGKTTLFNVCTGFYRPDAGNIALDGEDITGIPAYETYARGLVRSFQNPRLFMGMTNLENNLVPPKGQIGERLRNAPFTKTWETQEKELAQESLNIMKMLTLDKLARSLASEISGGQMKLMELSRSLMGKPKVLLLDEPTAGVAPKLGREIFHHIDDLRDNYDLTFAIIEHRLEMLFDFVDRVIVMHRGKIITEGKPDEVVKNPMVIDVYLGG